MKRQTRAVTSRPKLVLLGLQHTFVMFGATVLVPILTGLDVGVALFASGIGTLIFHLITRGALPVYLGSSFAFIPVITSIASTEGGSLAQACGAIVVAGAVYVLVSGLVRVSSVDFLSRILPPHVTGAMIILIGLVLAPVAIGYAEGEKNQVLLDAIGKGGCFSVALATLGVAVLVRVLGPQLGLRFLSTLPVLIALTAGYLLAMAIGIVDHQPVADAAWLGLPAFSSPEFHLPAVLIALPVALVTIMEHLGDVLAVGNVVGKDFVKRPGLHRTLLGDGVATSLSAFLGGPANTTYSENTGALALTGIHDPRVMRIAAVFAMGLAFVPKVGALIETIPTPVIGGILILLFGMIAAIGIKTLVDNRVDLNRPRPLIVVSVMLVVGLGGAQLELGEFRFTGLALASVLGIVLNLLLTIRDRS